MNDDGMGFYNFQDDTDWSNSAIEPLSCIQDYSNSGEIEDVVVYKLYGENHNQCSSQSIGTYKTPLAYFLKGYIKQMEREAEQNQNGNNFEAGEAIDYLYCSQFDYNNYMLFLKIACNTNTGKGFRIQTYQDMYCSEPTENQYNVQDIDISGLYVNFGKCQNCVSQFQNYNNYNNNNNNNNNNANGYYYQQQDQPYYRVQSPLCSAANYYKEDCNRKCQRAAKKGSSSSSGNRGMFTGEGFSGMEKVGLWLLTCTGRFHCVVFF